MKATVLLIQVLFTILFAPLVSGLVNKFKNNIRMRKGPSIIQPYYNLLKLCNKQEVRSECASWIFDVTPYIVFTSCVAAAFLVPVFASDIVFNRMGDFIALIFILALGRFFLALAALDTASSFGGMGASREMFISSLAEPVVLLSIFALGLQHGSTSIQAISSFFYFKASTLIAAVAFFVVIIAETSRIPVDNQETHLELTMVHEAMVLEYSGRSLALIELAAQVKQLVFLSLLANAFFSFGVSRFFDLAGLPLCMLIYLIKVLVIVLGIAVLEISLAKMRLFRVVDLLTFSTILAILALVCAAMGF